MKIKISIKIQIFLALSTIIAIMALIFSPYGFYTNVTSIKKAIDERLQVAVYGVLELLPADYHERVLKNQVSKEEYDILQKKLINFQKRIKITYLYAMVQKTDGKIYFTIDQEVGPMSEYEDPSVDTIEVFNTKKPISAQAEDADFDIISRTIMIPFYTKNGDMYVIGADLNTDDMNGLIWASIRDFAIIFILGIILVAIVTFILTKRISTPIKNLADYTKTLTDSNFSPEVKDLPVESLRTLEIKTLANSITQMRLKLAEYITNLETEMKARNLAESELKIAGDIQESFLPGHKYEDSQVVASAMMKPAKQAGGDLFDFFKLSDNRQCFAIGDVSGKGMPAALFMARAITLIRAAARTTTNLSEIVAMINDVISESNDSCMFITFFICAYDAKTNTLDFVNCGHNPPLIKRNTGETELMQLEKNAILGVFEDFEFKMQSCPFNKGDKLISFTDGVTEAIAPDDSFYTDERFEQFVKDIPQDTNVETIVKSIMDSVLEFENGCPQSDDITILSFEAK